MPENAGAASPRRLATILAADIAGYSRLVGLDEEGTLARVKRLRVDLVDPTVADHNGRIVKWMGDGFLAEFSSPVEAVRCAVVVQQSIAGRNAGMARQHWIQFRMGVNLGDIVTDSDDIFGEGVNLAARLQELAAPGGVYISGGIYELVKNKLVVAYQSLGDHKVKNITDPVRVYRVLPDPSAVAKASSARRKLGAAVILVVVLGGGGVAWWQLGPAARVRGEAEPRGAIARIEPSAAVTRPPPPETQSAPESEQRRLALATPPPVVKGAKPPEMASVPGGVFLMGSPEDDSEKPPHRVNVQPFSLGKYPVSAGEWRDCVAAGACPAITAGEDDAPMTNVSWDDAQLYAAWLSKQLNTSYRLPSEAEWEYAARGGAQTKYWWGNEAAMGMADCRGCGGPHQATHPLKIGSFPPNPFGLYDMTGGVAEWVADCWHKNYEGAPTDGSVWTGGDCTKHVLRGGSWQNDPSYLRAASRDAYDTAVRYLTHGFRLARSP